MGTTIFIAVCIGIVIVLIWLVPKVLNSITIKTNKMFDHPQVDELFSRGIEEIGDEFKHRKKVQAAKREKELRNIKGEDADENPRF